VNKKASSNVRINPRPRPKSQVQSHKRHGSATIEVKKEVKEWPRNNSIKLGEVFDRMLKVGEENRKKQGMRMKNFNKKAEDNVDQSLMALKVQQNKENSNIKKMLLNDVIESLFQDS